MATQVRTQTKSALGHVASAAFGQGYRDAIAGKPWRNLDTMKGNRKYTSTDTMWDYERGRYFAAYLQGEGLPFVNLKNGRKVSNVAYSLVVDAIRCKAIT